MIKGLFIVACLGSVGCGLFSTPSRADRAELTIEGLRALCGEFQGQFPSGSPPELEGACKALVKD